MSDMDAVLDQLRSAGLVVDAPLIIGKLVRCKTEGDKGSKKSGWYSLHEFRLRSGEVAMCGNFGNWKSGEQYKLDIRRQISEEDRAEYREAVRKAREAAEAEEARAHQSAAERAAKMWARLPDSGSAPYLFRKQVRAFGVRFCRQSVVVPVRHIDGRLVGLQFIPPEEGAGKKFLTGTPKKGGFHVLGEAGQGDVLIFAEGYATAASIHQATGFPVVVCFDKGNLLPVAEAFRAKYPKRDFLIAGDDDVHQPVNPGRKAAIACAKAVGARVALPVFEMQGAA